MNNQQDANVLKNDIKNSIYKNCILTGSFDFSALDNYQKELKDFVDQLVSKSMFPIVDANRLSNGQMAFLVINFQKSTQPTGLTTPFDIAKLYTCPQEILPVVSLNTSILKKDFALVQKSFDIKDGIKTTFCNILKNLDDSFQQLLDTNSTIANYQNDSSIGSCIVRSCNRIAQRTRRGAGNNVLINNVVYQKIKSNIDHLPVINYPRRILHLGKFNQSIDVYLDTEATANQPIYTWYSGPNKMDVPLILIQDKITFDIDKNQLINNFCFLNNSSKNSLMTSDYVDKLLWN